MLIHLYSANVKPTALPKKNDPEQQQQRAPRMANGHARVPNAADRQAADAQEFELEGLMSEDEDMEAGAGAQKQGNGRPR